jgi:hypothetical protein
MSLPNSNLSSYAASFPTVHYCDPGDIQRRLSQGGVQARIQDYGSTAGEAGSVEDVIWDATDIINYYCFSLYRPEDMVRSFWVNRRTTDIAVYLLEMRRGNIPTGSVAGAFKQAIEWLEKIHSSLFEIPGVPIRATHAPSFINIRIDQRYSTHRVRVEQTISDRTSAPYSRAVDWSSEYDFSI